MKFIRVAGCFFAMVAGGVVQHAALAGHGSAGPDRTGWLASPACACPAELRGDSGALPDGPSPAAGCATPPSTFPKTERPLESASAGPRAPRPSLDEQSAGPAGRSSRSSARKKAKAARAAAAAAAAAAERGFVEETINVPGFGKVSIYRPEPVQKTRGVVLFVSGDGGWNLGVVDMARRSGADTLVVGLSMPAWQKAVVKSPAHCWYPAGDLESVAQTVEKIYGLPRYIKPILVGYSSGATLVYGALAQAAGEPFAGAVSLGFCPDLDVARPFCGHADWTPSYDEKKRLSLLPPRPDLPARPDGKARWTILHGSVDKVCDPGAVGGFVEKIPAARVVPLPKVGHGFSVTRNWGDAYDEAITALLDPVTAWEALPGEKRAPPPPDAAEVVARLEALDLPLEISWPPGADTALIFVSGDGGWAELDQQVTAALSGRGVAMIGWNALRYFWQRKTPDGFRAALAGLLQAIPEGTRLFAGGYSFGAEVIPVALDPQRAERPAALARVLGLVLLAPGRYASFEVSPLDWILSGERPTSQPVRRALEAERGLPVLCVEPSERDASGCDGDPIAGLSRVTLPGGHHFAGDYGGLSERILAFMKQPPPEPAAPEPAVPVAAPAAAPQPVAPPQTTATPPGAGAARPGC